VIRVGLSVTDIGSLTWTKNVREVRAESTLVVDNPLDQVQRDGVERALRGEAQPGEAFSTPLPTTIRAGVAFELDRVKAIRPFILGEMTVACDIHQVLQEAPGSPAGTRLAFGMEWRPWGFLPLRQGIRGEAPTIGILRWGSGSTLASLKWISPRRTWDGSSLRTHSRTARYRRG